MSSYWCELEPSLPSLKPVRLLGRGDHWIDSQIDGAEPAGDADAGNVDNIRADRGACRI